MNWYKKNNFVDSNYYDNKLNLIEKNIKEVYKNYLVVKNINILNPLSLINFYKEKLKNLGVIFKKDNIYKYMILLIFLKIIFTIL